MTVIVADAKAGVMVSDTQVTDEHHDICYHSDKIVRCKDGSLAGAAGGVIACTRFLRWAKSGRKGSPGDIGEVVGIVLTPAGEILLYDNGEPDNVRGTFAAIGSGSSAALAAADAGADAVKCVAIAIKRNALCGGEIIIEHL